MDSKMSPSLLDHFGSNFSSATTWNWVLFIISQSDEMSEAANGGRAREWKTKDTAYRIYHDATYEKVEVVSNRLLEAAGWPVDQQRGEVLVHVV
mmetsp:Transcript_107674/g.240212  ORF Transcript_107674/g.240212 Transcript_107674/m.240212 type:complete len:94 (+) Transcript_107674:526-807(+)